MRKHRDLSSQKIINKTFQLIKHYGQQKITFSYVAKQLSIHSEALYTYFHNKNDLIIHVSIEYFHQVHQHAQLKIVGVSGTLAVIRYLEEIRKYGLQNIKVNNTAFSHAHIPEIKNAIMPIIKTLYNLLSPLYSTKECNLKAKELENQITGELVNENIGVISKNKKNFIKIIKRILNEKSYL